MIRGEFHGHPILEELEGPHSYKLIQTPAYWFGYKDSRGEWWIPRNGLHTDQGTINSIAQLISGVADDQCMSFILHDNGYQFRERDLYEEGPDGLPDLNKPLGAVAVTRDEVDYYCLAEGMYTEDVNFNTINSLQRHLVYRSVRIWQAILGHNW